MLQTAVHNRLHSVVGAGPQNVTYCIVIKTGKKTRATEGDIRTAEEERRRVFAVRRYGEGRCRAVADNLSSSTLAGALGSSITSRPRSMLSTRRTRRLQCQMSLTEPSGRSTPADQLQVVSRTRKVCNPVVDGQRVGVGAGAWTGVAGEVDAPDAWHDNDGARWMLRARSGCSRRPPD
jgi:hypothetical protein